MRLREGRAPPGALDSAKPGRVRYAGATGQITVRADSGFYNHAGSRSGKMKVRFSITVRLRQNLRDLIEAIPEADWRTGWRRGRDGLYPLQH